MGFFDKNSRQLRRKIKDLRAELKQAEQDCKFIVHEGIFFAEMEGMGDMTMQVFSTADLHDSQEQEVIRTFFDRNGFTVESFKMDRERRGLRDVEIVPPNEMLKMMIARLQEEGWRVTDEEDTNNTFSVDARTMPVEDLAAATSMMFSENVRKIVASTGIKITKEGNRLLSWMPMLIKTLEKKVDPDAIEKTRPIYEDAYAYFYLRDFDKGQQPTPTPPPASTPTPTLAPDAQEPPVASRAAVSDEAPIPKPIPKPKPAPPRPKTVRAAASSSQQVRPIVDEARRMFEETFARFAIKLEKRVSTMLAGSATPAGEASPAIPSDIEEQIGRLTHSEQLAKVLAAMYQSLVKANPSRCVKNAETLLHPINRLMNASATCVLLRMPQTNRMTIFAQSGDKLSWGEGKGGKGFQVSTTVIRDCVKQRAVATSQPMGGDPSESQILFKIESTAAAPVTVDGELMGVLYVDRRNNPSPFTEEDTKILSKLAEVFEQYPDLTLGLG